jgi:glycosyltransferase involved in cell wall biosynthesis
VIPTKRIRVLHVIPAFYPNMHYGGPITSTHNLCNGLAEFNGLDLKVLTTDSAGPIRGDNRKNEGIVTKYPAGYDVFMYPRIAGATVSFGLLRSLFSMIQWSDVVHLTGVYSFPTIPTLVLSYATRTPLVWSPRGALSRWIGSRRRKIKGVWDHISRRFIIPDHTLLHFTTTLEAETATSTFSKLPYCIIPNGIIIPSLKSTRQWLPGGHLRMLFIGRYHPIKGIERLLEAMKLLSCLASVRLFGDGDRNYIEELRKLIISYDLHNRVELNGFLNDDRKEEVFQSSDLLVLPSHSENFGMVVAEALAHGVPVLVSNKTPWREIESRGCGRYVDNDPTSLARAIEDLYVANLSYMGQRGREWMETVFSVKTVAHEFYDVYQNLIERCSFSREVMS